MEINLESIEKIYGQKGLERLLDASKTLRGGQRDMYFGLLRQWGFPPADRYYIIITHPEYGLKKRFTPKEMRKMFDEMGAKFVLPKAR